MHISDGFDPAQSLTYILYIHCIKCHNVFLKNCTKNYLNKIFREKLASNELKHFNKIQHLVQQITETIKIITSIEKKFASAVNLSSKPMCVVRLSNGLL